MIELHRHLEGSLRPETMLEVAREYGLPLISDRLEELRRHYEITPQDPASYLNFFSKFHVFRRFFTRREIIERVAREAVQDAKAEGIEYLELRFSPSYFAAAAGFDPVDVAHWIADAARGPGLPIAFIGTISRSFPRKVNQGTIDALLKTELFVGVDLAGVETDSDGREYLDVFKAARDRGLQLTVHAGEVPECAGRVREAVEELGAARIGHGIYADEAGLAAAEKRGVAFEMCPTSNRLLGVWSDIRTHPIHERLKRGLRVAVGADDPRIFRTTLKEEFERAGLASQAESISKMSREAAFSKPARAPSS